MTPQQREALDAIDKYGSQAKAAKALGISRGGLRSRLQGAKKYQSADPSVKGAMQEVGMQDAGVLHSGWIKTDGASLYFQMPDSEGESVESVADRISDRMNKVKPAPYIHRPKVTDKDKLNFVPLYDVHLGMRIGSYGTASAVDRIREGVFDVIERAPRTEEIIILNGGDFTEANDNSALTPANKHPLAVDMDFDDLSDIATDVTVELIEFALTKADKVTYQAIKGNHDHSMPVVLRQALRQRYRTEKRFDLRDGVDVFSYEWKGNFLTGIHGHQKVSNPQKLALSMMSRFRQEYGRTRRAELWRGHLHNEVSIAVPGTRINQVNPICPAGRYAKENLFEGESDVQCVTYKEGGGRWATTIHIYDD
jgi:hypothetical protein